MGPFPFWRIWEHTPRAGPWIDLQRTANTYTELSAPSSIVQVGQLVRVALRSASREGAAVDGAFAHE